jgi:hypothetical protein
MNNAQKFFADMERLSRKQGLDVAIGIVADTLVEESSLFELVESLRLSDPGLARAAERKFRKAVLRQMPSRITLTPKEVDFVCSEGWKLARQVVARRN